MFELRPPPDISQDAVDLLASAEVFDLHLDMMIPHRLVGYDLNVRHEKPAFGGRFFGHLDFPRAIENGLTAGMWSITTNPLRTEASRWRVLLDNLGRLQAQVEASEGRVRIAVDAEGLAEARAAGAIACLPAIQGGNSLAAAPDGCASVPDDLVTRVTLVHLSNSLYGATSSPLAMWRASAGLTDRGKALVEDLDRHRIFVDLAHINERGFWDAVEVHDKSRPLLATHTGVDGVKPHWRNLDDAQCKAIAETGGTIGIIFQDSYLRRKGGPTDGRMVVEHMAHVIDIVGEDFVSIGSDYDGAITPPKGLRMSPCYPRLVQWMLDERWSEQRVVKVLGGNAIRCLQSMRPKGWKTIS
jgi:membrane dipeptidase